MDKVKGNIEVKLGAIGTSRVVLRVRYDSFVVYNVQEIILYTVLILSMLKWEKVE